MAEIGSRKELEAFLKPRPREDSIAIAARVALRVIPALSRLNLRITTRRGMFLSCFRAGSISWNATEITITEIKNLAALASLAAHAHTQAAVNIIHIADVGFAAIAAAREAAGAAINATYAFGYAADTAVHADTAYTAINPAAYVNIWDSINADITALENGQTSSELAIAPLWPDGVPKKIDTRWQKLKSTLLKFPDENWQVWTDWYEARLKGGPFNAELEEARALLPDKLWKQGPKVVNAEIARLIEKYTTPTLPPEKDAPIHFELRDGQIHSAPPPATQPTDPEAMASAWRGLRELLDDLLHDLGGNQPDLRRKLERYGRAMGDMFSALDLHRFGIHGDSLKNYSGLAAKEFMDSVASDLLTLLDTHERFLAHYPEWKKFQAAIAKPFGDDESEIKALAEANKLIPIIDEVAPELMADDARIPLSDLNAQANEEKTPENRRSYLRAAYDLLRTVTAPLAQLVKKGLEKGIEEGVATQVKAVICAVGPLLLSLAELLPNEYGLLAALAVYLTNIGKGGSSKK